MSADAPLTETMADRYAHLLAGFAERCARMTAEIETRFQETDDPLAAARLCMAMHAMGRSLRQTIGLAHRLEQDVLKAQRQADGESRTANERQVAQRAARIRTHLQHIAWTEYEAEDDAAALDDLDADSLIRNLVAEAAEDPDFATGPLEPILARLEDRLRDILDRCLAPASAQPRTPALADSS